MIEEIYPVEDETETAESKRTEPNGPTFAFSTRNPCLVRSSLAASFCLSRPTACNEGEGIIINDGNIKVINFVLEKSLIFKLMQAFLRLPTT